MKYRILIVLMVIALTFAGDFSASMSKGKIELSVEANETLTNATTHVINYDVMKFELDLLSLGNLKTTEKPGRLTVFDVSSFSIALTPKIGADLQDVSFELRSYSSENNEHECASPVIDFARQSVTLNVTLDGNKPLQIDKMSATPNPFNSSVALTFPTTTRSVEIFDITGNLMKKVEVENGNLLWQPDEKAVSGKYIVKALSSDGKVTNEQVIYLK